MEQEELIDAKHALSHLDNKEILTFTVKGRANYVFLKDGVIFLSSDNYKTPVSKDDFLKLFNLTLFKVFQDDEETVDPVKDQQYYSWGRKM